MMKLRRLFLLVGVTVASGACHRSPAPLPPLPPGPMRGSEPLDWRAVVGCWRMGTTRLALDSLPAATLFYAAEPGIRHARVYPPPTRHGDVFWRTTPRNTVEVLIGDGLHGSRTEFVLRDGRLQGRRSIISDVVIPGVERPVEAVVAEREPCRDVAGASTPP
ncbi:MAG TPA: hypothetical protein VFT45_12900 [Longimicrobium sp.]|nr:hypothetical protein [Longimicrobium sp.]